MQPDPLNNPYLVVGSMRSGTSAVARVLHEQLGVTMFMTPPEPDEFNPDGYYEDLDVSNLNELAIRTVITPMDFIEKITIYSKEMIRRGKAWGLKDGRIAILSPLYYRLFPKAKVIRLCREPKLVVASMMRKYGWDRKKAELRIFMDNLFIDAVWKNNICASLDMTERRTDSDIKLTILKGTREL